MKTNLAIALSILPISILAQGPLTPPGAPAPTMKTLDQVEPRKEINATNTPGTATALFRIAQPGSYYLSANVTGVSAKNGIEIAANDVTLDLNGFALVGVGGSLSGVSAPGALDRRTLHGAPLRGGNACDDNGSGVGADGAGIHSTSAENRLESNSVSGNDRGIDVDSTGSLIIKNTAATNTTDYVIAASNRYGVIINITAAGAAAVNGNSAASTLTSTDPWANYSY